MNKSTVQERAPELREFIKEQDQLVYDFCRYMLFGSQSLDEVVLSVFREFGDTYRRLFSKKGFTWIAQEGRIQLFTIAWEQIVKALSQFEYSWTLGRDTRPLKAMDADLLTSWAGQKKDRSQLEQSCLERLSHIDADFRAPLILKDILRLEDEEIVRILRIRWGVFRHRLHRGRLEFREGLRGRA